MHTTQRPLSVAAQAAEMEAGEWASWIEERQLAVDKIAQTVKEQVASGTLEPLTGTRIIACATGSVFGYEEFHPRGEQLPAEHQLDMSRQLTERIGATTGR